MGKKIFSWLHLSDIHFQPNNESFNDVQIRKTLPVFLEKNNIVCDFIIITGDFRYGPKKEETSNDEVYKYINNISTKLNINDDNIIIVPGNHDLNRTVVRSLVIKGAREEYNPNSGEIDETILSSLSNDFVFYDSIQEKYKNGLKMHDKNPHRIVDLESCYFLLLNTSIVAGTDDDSHKLIVGSKYISDFLDSDPQNKPIIAIGHHGFDMLDDREKKTITNFLEKKGVWLYLCGHSHDNWLSKFSENGNQINVGCMSSKEGDVKVGFSLGALYDNGDVDIDMYMWDRNTKTWNKDSANCAKFEGLYTDTAKKETPRRILPTSTDCQFSENELPLKLYGFQEIGNFGRYGIKYVWKKKPDICIESVVYNQRAQVYPPPPDKDKKISTYTISTSMGCHLSAFGKQCIFCQTGANKYVPLTAEDVALQCIFMAEYDSKCDKHENVMNNMREFAFMGQGEPGLSYTQIKRAILLTDRAMEIINQPVSRYIISTCGITDFIPDLIMDINNNIYSNRVTIHFSLNAVGEDRNKIMPINEMYNHKDFIDSCHSLYEITNVKIGVGILLMENYQTKNGDYLTINMDKIQDILSCLDSKIFRIDFCTVNNTAMGKQQNKDKRDTYKCVDFAIQKGFESRLYDASCGDTINAACGMLTSSLDEVKESATISQSMIHYHSAVDLLIQAKKLLRYHNKHVSGL